MLNNTTSPGGQNKMTMIRADTHQTLEHWSEVSFYFFFSWLGNSNTKNTTLPRGRLEAAATPLNSSPNGYGRVSTRKGWTKGQTAIKAMARMEKCLSLYILTITQKRLYSPKFCRPSLLISHSVQKHWPNLWWSASCWPARGKHVSLGWDHNLSYCTCMFVGT